MICYIIPFRGNRQPNVSGAIVPLEAPGVRWGPLSRRRQNWRAALVGTAFIHLFAICPALLLVSHTRPPGSPADLAVEMVFAEPMPTQPELSHEPPIPQNAETPFPPTQMVQPPEQPIPPVPEAPEQPPTPPASFDPGQPDAAATPTPSERPEPLPAPQAPPKPPAKRANIPRKALAPPRIIAPAPSPDRPSSVSPPAEPTHYLCPRRL
jgi:protein TonB